jgi:hypothetical protein
MTLLRSIVMKSYTSFAASFLFACHVAAAPASAQTSLEMMENSTEKSCADLTSVHSRASCAENLRKLVVRYRQEISNTFQRDVTGQFRRDGGLGIFSENPSNFFSSITQLGAIAQTCGNTALYGANNEYTSNKEKDFAANSAERIMQCLETLEKSDLVEKSLEQKLGEVKEMTRRLHRAAAL